MKALFSDARKLLHRVSADPIEYEEQQNSRELFAKIGRYRIRCDHCRCVFRATSRFYRVCKICRPKLEEFAKEN